METCINANETGQCFYFTKARDRRSNGLVCDETGHCNNCESWRCVKYDPDVQTQKEKQK